VTWLRSNGAAIVAALFLYLTLVLVFQSAVGAPSAPFGAYPDEPSHYDAGLLTHDYLLDGIGQRPTSYAYRYYTHVPYIGVGYWPPLFYVAEALWMFCFGTDRAAVLWMTAFIAALCATLMFAASRKNLGNAVAFGAGLLFLLAPIVQWSDTMIFTDLAVGALSFGAVLAMARYLDFGESRDSAGFAVLAALALLTKASSLFLGVIPPAAVLVSGRWRLIARRSFWLIPFIVMALAGPWYWFARSFLRVGFEGASKIDYAHSLAELGAGLWSNLGWLGVLALAGLWSLLRERPVPGIAVVCALEPIAVVLFLALAPTGNEPRYLIAALLPVLVLSAYGVRAVAAAAGGKRRERLWASCLMTAIVLVAAHFWLFRFALPRPNEFRPIADFIVGHKNPVYTAVLVSADAEGPMIAEIAGRDPLRETRFLIRPGKLFARINWSGTRYALRYNSPQEMQALIDHLPVSLAIARRNPPPGALPHELMLLDAIHAFPDHWRAVRSFGSNGRIYDLFEPASKSGMSGEQLEAFLMDLLGGSFHPER